MNAVRSLGTLAAVAAALMLGLGATTLSAAGDDPETLRLHLGSDGTRFVYSNSGSPITQPISASKNCLISADGPLATIDGSDKGPGMKDGSIGIKSGGSTGVPCARVDSTEDLAVELTGVPDAVTASLDLEFKGAVRVDIVVWKGGTEVDAFQVRAGGGIVPGQGVDGSSAVPYTATVTHAQPIANCRNASDSGPDSGPNDNCYVTVEPTASFDSITFAPVMGEMSLEGSWDFGNNPAFDTIFTLEEYDGELGCTEENSTATIDEGTVYGSFTRLQNTDGSECVLKPYTLDVDVEAETLSFVPIDIGAPQPAAYEGTVAFAPKPSTNPFTSRLEYDQDDDGPLDFVDMPWCAGDPYATPDVPGSIDTSVIPFGHTWCIVQESTGIHSATQIRTTWDVVGIGDPKMR
ncbi:hypothetical protein GCM10017608_20180 [Agromyces luteolus]|uniref:Uncharacterized protein n=1 Tax=Agromyces luteolus TaxID=88373 RepID=A0A7C9HIK6_9MICO|nr:hypothetical protein [Agromyces luteolus]MUN07908.1 hypothetical protein [Agromyces luteolus]GLK28084.1 hypothetical protein GCM10017608_20180 [Agromyces luteolus]